MGERKSALLSNYQQSLEYLFGLQKHGIKFGLNRTENLLARFGSPHEKLRCIHVAGTNGKGSTAAMLSSVLKQHGYRVGLYTSPHLVRFTERFRIDDEEVAPERILKVFEEIRQVLEGREPPTFFEMTTAMALLYFAQEQVDWAVIEVGMGGRLDATNVIRPEASIITGVSFDHEEFLGKSLASIAREKAGIIKEGVPVVTGARQPVVLGILKTTCLKKKTPLYKLGSNFRVRRDPDGSFNYKGLRHFWSGLRINLKGTYQYSNAAVAIAVLETLEKRGLLSVDSEALRQGMLQVHWPARFEILSDRPLIILDGAHNPQGAEGLRDALKSSFPESRIHLVLGIMHDKDVRGILRRLLPIAETAIFTQPRYYRAADPDEFRKLARPYIQKQYVIPDPASAIEQARLLAAPEDVICIAGSLYFAGEVKQIFGEPSLL